MRRNVAVSNGGCCHEGPPDPIGKAHIFCKNTGFFLRTVEEGKQTGKFQKPQHRSAKNFKRAEYSIQRDNCNQVTDVITDKFASIPGYNKADQIVQGENHQNKLIQAYLPSVQLI